MKTAVLFPGQGSQYVGMCSNLVKQFPVAARVFEEASDILKINVCSLVFDGNIRELTLSENAQPVVVIASYASFKVLEHEVGLSPFCCVGHSLGEITAFIASGALEFIDGLIYTKNRGLIMHRAMQEKVGHAGIVVDLELKRLTSVIN